MSASVKPSSSAKGRGLRSLAFVVALAGFGQSASAAESNQWQGFYAGLNVGYGWSGDIDNDFRVNPLTLAPGNFFPGQSFPFNANSADGAFGGVQLGYNQQYGNFILGVEVDIQKADISGSAHYSEPIAPDTYFYDSNAELDWFGTVRLRGGYTWNSTLLYVTGGFAYGEFGYHAVQSFDIVINKVTFDSSSVETGWVLGAGIEQALGPNWTIKAEYQYLDFGDKTLTAPFVPTTGRDFSTDLDMSFHTLRIGVNYKLQP